jgi:hypothetical protein
MATRISFLIAAAILFAGAFYYRAHNAADAKAQVATIQNLDAAGSDTSAALANLRAYVKSHMGASATFTLTDSYNRAAAATNAAAAAAAANAQVYAAAQAACSGHTDSITQAECNQKYLAAHLVNEPSTQATTPPRLADYEYNLRAPSWTPDLAGALFLGAIVALAAAVFYPRKTRRRV